MTAFRLLRSFELCALCVGLALLSGCGGGSSPSNATGTPVPVGQCTTSYDFSSLDDQLPNYPGKAINFIVQPISYSNVNNAGGGINTMTPSYVFTQAWASSLGTAAPLDVVSCTDYPGNGSATSGYPVVYEKPFQVAYQNVINAMLQHYQGNSNIGYIRFGLSVGGEADPYCTSELVALLPSGTDFNTTWEGWISTMDTYEKSVLPNPPIQLMESLNHIATDSTYVSVPEFAASTAVADGFGFGSNGFEQSDISAAQSLGATPCNSDWCGLFAQYAGQVPLELQQATPSDPLTSDQISASNPNPSNPTGSLASLVPVAAQNHATILEVYMTDLYLAFDPNYVKTPGANSLYSPFASQYAAAFSNPCAGVTGCSMQINALQPPSPSDADWSDFQSSILNNSAVHGVNLYVPWNSVDTSTCPQ
jgi:hypothetical protein